MSTKINALAVVSAAAGELSYVPSRDDVALIMEEVRDMDRVPYGRIKIPAGGTNIYQIYEPGEEEPDVAKEFEGVIIMSHKTNGLWLTPFGGNDKAPSCSSLDGATGMLRETGELVECDNCPYNQYGSANQGNARGKACKNMRRLYILRKGDIFPMVLTLPPTALSGFDNFRTKVMMGRKKLSGIVTKFALKSAKNQDGIAYSVPVFDAVAALTVEDAQYLAQYADKFTESAMRNGVTADDYSGASEPAAQPQEATPVEATIVDAPADETFTQIDD